MKNIFIILFITLVSTSLFAQQFTVSGNVGDLNTGKKLGYANIRIANTTNGTAANLAGRYELKLNAGRYVFIASYIGYYSDTLSIQVNGNILNVDFRLTRTEISLPEIVVMPGENPALEIIRNAIAKKNEMNSKLISYEFEAYTKGILRTEDEVFARGNSLNLSPGENDTTQLKITGILESRSKGYYKKPDRFKEIILARKQSANFPSTINTLTSGRIIQNFYENNVRFLGGELPGPISDDALDYYQFYIDEVTALNDEKVFNIKISPMENYEPGFIGNIYITDSSFNLIKVDLKINDAANPGGILDTIRVVQQFAEYNNIYMPVDYHLLVQIDFMGLVRAGFELNSVLYDYSINPEVDDAIFGKAIVTVLPDADKKDSLYWSSNMSIPNTGEEESAYKRIDSLGNIPRSFWEDFSVLNSQLYLSDKLSISGPLNWYSFNKVSGHSANLTFYLDDVLNKRLNTSLDLSYGFSDKKFKTDFYAEYLFGDYRTFGLTINAYITQKVLFEKSDKYSNLTATIAALLFKDDFRDYYYSNGVDVTFEGEVTPILSLSLGYINHTDKSGVNTSNFSIFNKDKHYRENPAVFEGKINAITAGFSIDFRPFIENGYFRTRTSGGESYFLFSGDITYSNPDFLGSKLNYKVYKLGGRGFIRTFRSASLDIRLFGMYNDGTLPYQDLHSLAGNINLISKSMTFRTLQLNEVLGDRVITLNLEHHFRDELFRMLNVPGLKNANINLILFINAAISQVGEDTNNLLPVEIKQFPHPFYEIGFGIGQGIIPLQLEFAWKLNYKDGNNFRVSLNALLF